MYLTHKHSLTVYAATCPVSDTVPNFKVEDVALTIFKQCFNYRSKKYLRGIFKMAETTG